MDKQSIYICEGIANYENNSIAKSLLNCVENVIRKLGFSYSLNKEGDEKTDDFASSLGIVFISEHSDDILQWTEFKLAKKFDKKYIAFSVDKLRNQNDLSFYFLSAISTTFHKPSQPKGDVNYYSKCIDEAEEADKDVCYSKPIPEAFYEVDENLIKPHAELAPPLIKGRVLNEKRNNDKAYFPSNQNQTRISKIHTKVASLFNARKNLNKEKSDEVSAAVYAPTIVRPDDWIMAQVFLYKLDEYAKMERKARMADKDVSMRNYTPLDLLLKRGTKVDVTFNMPDSEIECTDGKKTIVWQGHLTNCQFNIHIPKDFLHRQILCLVTLSIDKLPIAEMSFTVSVEHGAQSVSRSPEIYIKKYSHVFISYAHQDARQVQFIAEAYRALGDSLDYFFDRHDLKPGDIYKDKIFEAIDHADLFILCWSQNALASKWVNMERERALGIARKKMHPLKIYPISIEPTAALPDDMKDIYTFGDLIARVS